MHNYKNFLEDSSQKIPKTTANNRRTARINTEAVNVVENNLRVENHILLPMLPKVYVTLNITSSSLEEEPDAPELEQADMEIGVQLNQSYDADAMDEYRLQNNNHLVEDENFYVCINQKSFYLIN